MSNAASGIYSRLHSGSGLNGVPVTPKVRTDDNFPAITYNLIAATPVNSVLGFSHLTRFLYQIDIWSRTYTQAIALAVAARNALIASNVPAFNAIYIDRREDYDAELKVYNVQLDFSVTSNDD